MQLAVVAVPEWAVDLGQSLSFRLELLDARTLGRVVPALWASAARAGMKCRAGAVEGLG